MTVKEIISLTPSRVIELHDKVRSGDPAAVRDLVFYGAWLSILKQPDMTRRQRLATLGKMMRKFRITVEVERGG